MTTIKSKALKTLKAEKEKLFTQPVTVTTLRALGALFWNGTITTRVEPDHRQTRENNGTAKAGRRCASSSSTRERPRSSLNKPEPQHYMNDKRQMVQEDRCFAFGSGAMMADGLPASEQRELARTLCRASAEQLAVFRERVEAGASLKNSDGIVALIAG